MSTMTPKRLTQVTNMLNSFDEVKNKVSEAQVAEYLSRFTDYDHQSWCKTAKINYITMTLFMSKWGHDTLGAVNDVVSYRLASNYFHGTCAK